MSTQWSGANAKFEGHLNYHALDRHQPVKLAVKRFQTEVELRGENSSQTAMVLAAVYKTYSARDRSTGSDALNDLQ